MAGSRDDTPLAHERPKSTARNIHQFTRNGDRAAKEFLSAFHRSAIDWFE